MADTPDVYSDNARIIFGPGGVTLVFMRSVPTIRDDEPSQVEPVAFIRMSHSMSGQVAVLINNALKSLEAQVASGEARMGIEEVPMPPEGQAQTPETTQEVQASAPTPPEP